MKRTALLALLVLLLAALACVVPVGGTRITTQQPLPTLPSEVTPDLLPTAPSPPAAPGAAMDLTELYERAAPGVVAISTFSEIDGADQSRVPLGQGSGFVIDTQGHIVTNQHVIAEAEAIEVDFSSGLRTWAEVLGTDPDSDLAVLKVEVPSDQLHPLPLGDSNLVRVGEAVVAIGNPYGLSGSITSGIVSAIGRTLESEHAAPGGQPFTSGDIIQTDAAINPGNSGGPLINLRGEVIGVNRAIRTETYTILGSAANSGVGFAVPINIVRRVAPALIETGQYDYPYLGISSLNESTVNLITLELIDLPPDTVGIYVTCVTEGGPAARAGVRGAADCDSADLRPGGDLILAIDGHPLRTFNDLISYLVSSTQVGQKVVLTVLRGGKPLDLTVTLAARP